MSAMPEHLPSLPAVRAKRMAVAFAVVAAAIYVGFILMAVVGH